MYKFVCILNSGHSTIYDDYLIEASEDVVELKFFIEDGKIKDGYEYKYALKSDTFEAGGMYFYNDGVNAGIFDEELEYIQYEKIEQMFGEFSKYYEDIQEILKINGIIASNYCLLIKEDSTIEEIDALDFGNIRSLGEFDSHPILNTQYTGIIYDSYVHFYADEDLANSYYIETDKIKFSSLEKSYVYLKEGGYKTIDQKHINGDRYTKYISNKFFIEAKFEDFGNGLFLPTAEVKKETISFLLDIFRRNNISDYIFYISGSILYKIIVNNKIDIKLKNDSFRINGEYVEEKDVEKYILRKDEGFITDFKTFIRIYS